MSVISELLLVEDDLLLARAVQRNLMARGIGARHVARCSTAAALRGPFALGVFDIELPDGDGVELARSMLFRGVVSRAVFFTACAQPQRIGRAREVGAVFVKSGNLSPLIEGLAPRISREYALRSLQ